MEKVFADVIKLQILKCVPPELLGWALNPMTSALVREKQRERLQGPKGRQRGLEGGRGSGDEAAGAGRPAAERQGTVVFPTQVACLDLLPGKSSYLGTVTCIILFHTNTL